MPNLKQLVKILPYINYGNCRTKAYLTNHCGIFTLIASKNNFLAGDGAIRPGDALNIVKYELDLRCPNRIVATKLRKHTATIAQVHFLTEVLLLKENI